MGRQVKLMKSSYNRASNKRNRNYSNKKKKEEILKKNLIQTIICIIALAAFVLINNINVPFTSNISKKINSILSYNIDFKSVYKDVETFARDSGIFTSGKSEDSDEPEEMEEIVLQVHEEKEDDNSEEEFRDGFPRNTCEDEIDINRDVIAPVKGNVGSEFGMRNHPIYGREIFHYGIDIEAEEGTPIMAAMGGKVEKTARNDGYGNYIIINHEEELFTLYAHCSEIIAEEGQEIKIGESIAKVGNTGNTSGTHLHFEIWKDKKALNPLYYITID